MSVYVDTRQPHAPIINGRGKFLAQSLRPCWMLGGISLSITVTFNCYASQVGLSLFWLGDGKTNMELVSCWWQLFILWYPLQFCYVSVCVLGGGGGGRGGGGGGGGGDLTKSERETYICVSILVHYMNQCWQIANCTSGKILTCLSEVKIKIYNFSIEQHQFTNSCMETLYAV